MVLVLYGTTTVNCLGIIHGLHGIRGFDFVLIDIFLKAKTFDNVRPPYYKLFINFFNFLFEY